MLTTHPFPNRLSPSSHLHAVGLQHLDLAVVHLDDQLDAQLAVGREQELLELLRVLELVEGL